MCPRYKNVIETCGMGCLLNFVRIEVPLRLVKWLASRFDVPSSEFQLKKKFIPITKYDIHNILDLPVDGEPLLCDPESGRDFVLSLISICQVFLQSLSSPRSLNLPKSSCLTMIFSYAS
uniref:Uncharacterized protein n=1 Tax=Triticum urartu TaxID=4572 RepID=A0A8R7TPR9_TRIUA